MEIQSLGGIRPPEGGGLAYPCRVPIYMWLYMTWLCRFMDVSPPGRFAPSQDVSPPGRFAPDCGRFAPVSGLFVFAPACKL